MLSLSVSLIDAGFVYVIVGSLIAEIYIEKAKALCLNSNSNRELQQ
jgi:hypothetical protein